VFSVTGILAYFGYPHAHEDDGERAARAALAALTSVSELPVSAKHAQLGVRIGIATGPVVVGDIVGTGASQESVVLGEVPNLAARLQSIAVPGCVVISASTRHLLGNGFAFEDLGTHLLKGIDEPVPAWRLLRALHSTSRFERTRSETATEMVGRDEELAILTKRWLQSRTGEGQVAFVSGEAGIGKSCMLNALRTQLEVDSYTPLSYQCSPFHSSTALHPIIVQLRHAAGIRVDDSAQTMSDKFRQVIRQSKHTPDDSLLLLAELANIPLLDEPLNENTSALQRKDQTLQALLGQLAELQGERPVLLVFEDVHWIDPTTVELIELCVRWACSKHVLMLITHRPEYHGSWDGEAHVTTLSLRKLSRSVSSSLINVVVGNLGLPASLVDEIVDKTDGIPLFVEELTKTVIESDMVQLSGAGCVLSRSLDTLSIPSTLQASLTA